VETPSQTDTRPRYATVAETAVRLRLHRITVYKLTARGLIPSVKVGARVLIPESYFDGLDVQARMSAGLSIRASSDNA